MRPGRYDRHVRTARPPLPAHAPGEAVAVFLTRETLPGAPEPLARDAASAGRSPWRAGRIGTVIVRNGECPYACVMCGYWRDNLPGPAAPGVTARQVAAALDRLDAQAASAQAASHDPEGGRAGDPVAAALDAVKLYNGSSLFEPASIPPGDLPAIAGRCAGYAWTIVESRADLVLRRPRSVTDFAAGLAAGGGRLEVAIGLEAADDALRAALNRREPLSVFDDAVRRLIAEGIAVKAFILVKPPFVAEGRALDLARRSVDHAFERGAGTVALIPTVATPGLMQGLARDGYFSVCDLRTLAAAVAHAVGDGRGRVLVDTENLARLPGCGACRGAIEAGLRALNLGARGDAPACGCEASWTRLLETDAVRGWAEYREAIA